jgi:hypothetical protein
MFFRRRQGRPGAVDIPGYDPIDDTTHEAAPQQSEQLREWRRCAQRVTRAWNPWLAAEPRDGHAWHHAFVSALADEEHAAAKAKTMIQSNDTNRCGTRTRC